MSLEGHIFMVKSIFNNQISPENLEKLNKYIVQDGFHNRLEDIGSLNLSVMKNPRLGGINIFDEQTSTGSNIDVIDEISKYKLKPENGLSFSSKLIVTGYDESKLQFDALEGTANITSHSLLTIAEDKYYPISLISIYFYTRSKELAQSSDSIKYSENPNEDSNRDYAIDRSQFILDHAIENSILFIDGPLLGGNLSSYTLSLVSKLHDKNVIPIFIVKNSESNLITNNFQEIKQKYNSDLHWAHQYLGLGERTNFFHYIDQVNSNNTKVFSYIKPFSYISPQRVELHPDTYSMYEEYIGDFLDLIYYFILVQGDTNNPQLRPISIAEKYAREIINTINTRIIFRHTSLVPTMNQKRFGV